MVVAIATEGDEDIRHHADHVIYIPKVRDAFSAITASVPLQLFARAIAVEARLRRGPAPQPGEIGDGGVTGGPVGPRNPHGDVQSLGQSSLRCGTRLVDAAVRIRSAGAGTLSVNRQVGC